MNHTLPIADNIPHIARQVAFTTSAFDYLKDFQREFQAKQGVSLTNNQVLNRIIADYQTLNPINRTRGVRNYEQSSDN
jgi:hypothetical protein